MHEFAAVVAAQPAPHGPRGRRHLDAGARACREIAQAGHLAPERQDDGAAQADDGGGRVDGGHEPLQRRPGVATRHDCKREITGEAWHRIEDAGLCGRHGGPCRRAILAILACRGARPTPAARIRIRPDERIVRRRDNRKEDASGS
jgi:hypothetical protein